MQTVSGCSQTDDRSWIKDGDRGAFALFRVGNQPLKFYDFMIPKQDLCKRTYHSINTDHGFKEEVMDPVRVRCSEHRLPHTGKLSL